MSSSISRRHFIRGALTGAAGLTAMGVLGACSSTAGSTAASSAASETAASFFKAGTYTSIQHSPYATIEVTCTFSDSALTDVKYQVLRTSKADYFSLLTSPLEKFCQSIVANGKADGVDGVTGATVTSKAVVKAVNSAKAFVTGADVSSSATEWGG